MTEREEQVGTWAIECFSGFFGGDEARLKMGLGCRFRKDSI